jgi:hypothetical protein
MEIINKVFEAIKNSPLKVIQGDCRLINLDYDKWAKWREKGFFTKHGPEERTIEFSTGNQLLGGIVIKQKNISFCEFTDDETLNLEVRFEFKGNWVIIRIECKDAFPDLQEFGRFVAYINKK